MNFYIYIPMFFTFLRILLAPIIAVGLYNNISLSIINSLIIIAGVSDFLDGFLARKLDTVSKLGSILDPLADKLFVIFVFIALYYKGKLPFTVLLIFLLKDLILIIGFLFLNKGDFNQVNIKPLFISKISMTLQFLLAFILIQNSLSGFLSSKIWLMFNDYVLYGAIITTIISFFLYINFSNGAN